jgi:ABC-type transporter Mla subunit MlaD
MQGTKRNKMRTRFYKKTLKHKKGIRGGASLSNAINSSIDNANRATQRFNSGVSKINSLNQRATERLNNAVDGLDNMQNKVQTLWQSIKTPILSSPIVPKEGILEIAGDTALDAAEGTAAFVGKKLLRLLGLQPIDSGEPAEQDAASKIASKVFNIVDDKFGDIIQKLNNFLGDKNTRANIATSSKNLVEIFKLLLQDFNKTLNDPILKEEFVIAVYILGEYTKIFADAMDEPLDEAVDLLHDAILKALGGVSSGSLKVITDFAGAVPYAGAFVDLGKAINDGSKAAISVFDAGVNAVEAGSLLVGKTSQELNQAFEQVKAKQQEASDILKRADDSIQNFVKTPSQELGKVTDNLNNKLVTPIKKLPISQVSVGGSGSRKIKKYSWNTNFVKTRCNRYTKM